LGGIRSSGRGRAFRNGLAGAATALGLALATAPGASALTFVVDFKEAAQGLSSDIFGATLGAFDVTGFGFAAGDLGLVTDSVLASLRNDYYGIVTSGINPLSPIPDGQQLDVDFVIGDIGSAPVNGDLEYYYVHVGSDADGNTFLGQACLGCVRNSGGAGPNFGVSIGAIVASVLTDNINALAGVGAALTTGDLVATTNAITGTLSHEIGHALSLDHCFKAGAITDNGNAPLMGTGALDMPNADRIVDREFSFSCTTPSGTQNSVGQLVSAIGLRDAPAQPMSEPGLVALFGVGLAGMAIRRRGVRRAA